MVFEIERAAGGRWRWLLVDGARLVAVGGLKRTRLGAWVDAIRARRATARAAMPCAEWIDTGRLTEVLTDGQLEAHERLAERGPARTWAVPAGSVVVAAGDYLAVLEPEPSHLLVWDLGLGLGRAIEGPDGA
jgi:hypothetical protein